jgi:cysteinyl-tRNA synthetase
MSKSLKNFTTIAEGLKTMTANQLRLLFMMHDYRNPLTFNDYIMNNTKISDQTIKNFFDTMIHYPFNMDNIKLNQPEIELRNYFSRAQLEITDNLNNLNLHLVSTSIFELINKVNAYVKHNDPNISLINEITRWLSRLLTDLGFSYGNNNTNSSLNDVMSTLIETRTELRNLARDKGIDKETKYKLFSILDSQRDVKLSQIGIILKDTKDSSLWHVEKIEQ